jgi:hypothetical protein
MKFTLLSSAISTVVLFIAGCVTPTVLAPGAEQVRITQKAADVATCTAVGNVRVGRAADNSLALNLGRKGAVIERNTPLACKVI